MKQDLIMGIIVYLVFTSYFIYIYIQYCHECEYHPIYDEITNKYEMMKFWIIKILMIVLVIPALVRVIYLLFYFLYVICTQEIPKVFKKSNLLLKEINNDRITYKNKKRELSIYENNENGKLSIYENNEGGLSIYENNEGGLSIYENNEGGLSIYEYTGKNRSQ